MSGVRSSILEISRAVVNCRFAVWIQEYSGMFLWSSVVVWKTGCVWALSWFEERFWMDSWPLELIQTVNKIFQQFTLQCHNFFKATNPTVTVTRQKIGNATGLPLPVTVASLQLGTVNEPRTSPSPPHSGFQYISFPSAPTPSRSGGTVTAESWTVAAASNSTSGAFNCPKCKKSLKRGTNQKSLNDHMRSNKCIEARDPTARRSTPIPPLAPPQSAPPERCAGIPLSWDPATFWETYPFHSPLERLSGRSVVPERHACAKCSDINFDISIIHERASRPFERVHDHSDLNVPQLRAKVERMKDSLNSLKLKDSIDSTHERLKEYVDLIQFMGQHSHEIPALHRLLANAVANGWSANIILEHCQLGIEGKYTARNYSLYEIYLGMLIEELGGAAAIYALNHSIFALPSRDTIRPYRSQAKLMPSVCRVRVDEISRNISALFAPRATETDAESRKTAKPAIYGHTLSFDEVATEHRIDYFPETDEMGGLCLEHLPGLDTVQVGTDTKTVEAAVTAVREGKLHIAHETSSRDDEVVVFAGVVVCFGEKGSAISFKGGTPTNIVHGRFVQYWWCRQWCYCTSEIDIEHAPNFKTAASGKIHKYFIPYTCEKFPKYAFSAQEMRVITDGRHEPEELLVLEVN
ncbi:hypothetical protein C8F04DRAFT_1196533 [Mycena alexandri]|uniref:Uncharacterized protein n=1 Tax=Mycena alexandri TaxID=1745969 RepID=A0AAD6WN31_9AGAR|nr:hypothetical protein C8F04DRAFT_1196533 [Mycena alexandri]